LEEPENKQKKITKVKKNSHLSSLLTLVVVNLQGYLAGDQEVCVCNRMRKPCLCALRRSIKAQINLASLPLLKRAPRCRTRGPI
jgi:hypothetical protein